MQNFKLYSLVFPLLLSFYFCGDTYAQAVILNTRTTTFDAPTIDDGTAEGFSFTDGDFVNYDLDTSVTSLFLPEVFPKLNLSGFGGNPLNPDALSVRGDGSFVFSSRLGITVNGQVFGQQDLIQYNPNTNQSSSLFRQQGFDIAGIAIRENGNYLLTGKSDLEGFGINNPDFSFSVGDVIEWNPETGLLTTFFSHENFVETAAVASIDALELVDGKLLFSTTNAARIVDSDLELEQAGVYAYDLETGEVSTFFDPDLITTPSSDLKSFSLLPTATIPEPSSAIFGLIAMLWGSTVRRRKSC